MNKNFIYCADWNENFGTFSFVLQQVLSYTQMKDELNDGGEKKREES